MDEIEQSIINDLILQGALEVAGVDSETGEILYNFSEKIKTIMPALYEHHLKLVNEEIMFLWEKGYVDMNLLSDSPEVTLSSKSFDEVAIAQLSSEKQRSLSEIKRVLMS